MKHIVWDWNGTLLDDRACCITALNRLLAERSLPRVTTSFYRRHFGFPVKDFYTLLGMEDEGAAWEKLCVDFHRYYAECPRKLRVHARHVVKCFHAAGFQEHVVSVLSQNLLMDEIAAHGLTPFFTHVSGTDNLHGAEKTPLARALIAAIPASDSVTFIGDTIHDAEVARACQMPNGPAISCILLSAGHQTATRLKACGYPVVSSLMGVLHYFQAKCV